MEINLIALAIPVFLISMAIEYVISVVQKKQLYRLNDFTNNISCGILEQVTMLPLKGLLIFSYHYFYQHFSVFEISPHSIVAWFLLWLGVDFCYYWFHRASHRCNFLWTGHAVHHQSEYYNLSVALRQGMVQTLCSWVIYLPLAFLGFPTWMFLLVVSANTLYQFWIHTQLIQRMGWFEVIFNTPSHHRVHHGKNPEYIDKNYAGSLIIWDKLFGTFQKETIPADYGTTEPLASWNPFFANVKVLYDTYLYGKKLSTWPERMLAFFMPPEWIVKRLNKQSINNKTKPNKDVIQYPGIYVLLNLSLTILLSGYYLLFFNPSLPLSWMLGFFILITLYLIGFVLNRGIIINIKYTEFFRSILVLIIFHLMFESYVIDFIAMIVFFIVNVSVYQKRFLPDLLSLQLHKK
ncbi:sterol desaturase family protein [Legionella hackeliae]|uniref:Putative sterol desaturase-related protein n=1 Tax=Legionella hackeliae TaxID=449 RepID=A0A0A8USL4_LEGHA|nr:sterol desaturase family protein [Legionella hackeliae]KTD10554.1 sterol desaturase-related protein [Legionella hackeliae]CEK10057.1 putative sterol desaturase-related protein [Legionella hackeliae]STX46783.1 sterol desaturase-related protein [Legionella hackeliae]